MSNFSQSMDHAVDFFGAGQDPIKGRMWNGRAESYLRDEYEWGDHFVMTVRSDVPAVGVTCTHCKERRLVTTVGAALRFRDEHIHCGELAVDAWTCPTCGNGQMNHEKHCRFCWTERHEDVEWTQREPRDVIGTCEQYAVVDEDGSILSVLEVPSLLLARRAARHLFRREEVTVHMLTHPHLVWRVEDTGAAPELR